MSLTIKSISQIRFLPGQKLSLKLPQSSTAILAALDAATHAFDTTEVKTPYHFFNTTGAHIALEEQYNATTVLFVSNADYIDNEFAKLLITGEVSLSPRLKKESLLLLRHLYNFNIDWRVVLTGQEFWKTELSDHYKKIFNQDSLDFQNTSQRNLFDSNSAALLAAHKAIQQLKTDVPPTLFKNVPPSLPTYLVGIFATMQDLHFGCGIGGPKHITEQDWTRRVWAILIDSLFSFAPTFIQSSNANLKDEARRPDHRISLRISNSEATAVLLIATEDQKEKFVDPWLHKDFRKLIRTLRKALRSILTRYPGGTDLQVFGILFGGPCVCILKMTATTYTPSKRNPDRLPRPVFHLALSPVWSFEDSINTPTNLTEYLSAISEVYAYAVGLTEVKRRKNSILGLSEMPIQGAMSGGKRRKYPTTFIQPLVAKRSRSGDEDDEETDQEGDGDDEGKGDEETDGESDA